MSNPLTGDFEAVLQVSNGTINRLLASMHQNAFADRERPSFPHSVRVRLGDDRVVDGVKGTVNAQIGAPRLDLIDGVTDRFWIEVAVRAHYVADAGTRPLPAFIHGTVRAQYRLSEINPKCFGWAKKANDYLWIRVVKNTVKFQGTTADDPKPGDLATAVQGATVAEDHAAVEARISRQFAALLSTQFAPLPYPVSNRFRRGSMRSIAATAGDSAVVIPVGLHGDPVGDLASVGDVFLKTADFAIAVNRDALLAVAEPALAAIRAFKLKIAVKVSSPILDVDTVYTVALDEPTVAWQPMGSLAVIKVKVSGGATTKSRLPNVTFTVEQDILLQFDAGAEVLFVAVGARTVDPHAKGPFSGEVEDRVKKEIEKEVKPIVEQACQAAQPALDQMIARKQELVGELQKLDAASGAEIASATFLNDGMILRGRISVSPRKQPVIAFEKTAAQDGFTALKSFIPGGHIDKLEWKWTWFGSGAPGSSTFEGRFLLRRPGGHTGRFGQSIGLSLPLPGLDGFGKVCLHIEGVRINPNSSAEEAASGDVCQRFGLDIFVDHLVGSIFVPDVPDLVQDVPFPQLGVVDLIKTHGATPASSNTLIVYANPAVSAAANEELVSTLREGLRGVRRTDAGLMLALVVPEGYLAKLGPLAEIEQMGEELGLGVLVGEDLGGRWAAIVERSGHPRLHAFRLIGPDGRVRWQAEDRIGANELASELDRHLVTSLVARPSAIATSVEVGEKIGLERFRPGIIGAVESPCPALPGGAGISGTVVTFVRSRSADYHAHLTRLARRAREAGAAAPTVLVIVDGANQSEAECMEREVGLEHIFVSDPKRAITESFGVRVWPTTITMDPGGMVTAVELGVDTALEEAKAGLAYAATAE